MRPPRNEDGVHLRDGQVRDDAKRHEHPERLDREMAAGQTESAARGHLAAQRRNDEKQLVQTRAENRSEGVSVDADQPHAALASSVHETGAEGNASGEMMLQNVVTRPRLLAVLQHGAAIDRGQHRLPNVFQHEDDHVCCQPTGLHGCVITETEEREAVPDGRDGQVAIGDQGQQQSWTPGKWQAHWPAPVIRSRHVGAKSISAGTCRHPRQNV
mmetsp:Transcript_109192/g.307922  ORF Transcript_109192/g.307922 Transcript_109192/m.307922 type:complete len:214 (-) Transcript_109192:42-683(-)